MEIVFKREALYDEVWTVPLTQLGKKYGLSDNGIRKVCKAMNIPLPTAGHWAKIAAGQKLPRKPLPPKAETIEFTSRPPQANRPFWLPADDEWLAERKAFESDPQNLISFDPKPARWHVAVRPLRDMLRAEVAELPKIKRDADRAEKSQHVRLEPNLNGWKWHGFVNSGELLCNTHRRIPMRVTPRTYERALGILNSLCVQAQARGFSVTLDEKEGRIVFEGFEGDVQLRIAERLDDEWRSEQSSWDKTSRKVKYKVPTGTLRLYVGETWSEICIADLEGEPIEGRLNEVFLKIYSRIVRCRERRRESKDREERWAEERRQREEEERRRQEIAAAREAERRRRYRLLKEARNWETAKLLRAYIAHVERLPSEEAGPRNAEWRSWAKGVVDDLDPQGKLLDR